MLQLYFDPTCPFCQRVLHFFEAEQIPFEPKQMSLREHGDVRAELIELSGRSQVPFLVDPERNVEMPESADIIRYVQEHYLNG